MVLLQEKWSITGDCLGSGNTKNIGSIKDIDSEVPYRNLNE
ncbi:MAG: type II restriction endonuclease [bacterium]